MNVMSNFELTYVGTHLIQAFIDTKLFCSVLVLVTFVTYVGTDLCRYRLMSVLTYVGTDLCWYRIMLVLTYVGNDLYRF